MYNLLCGTTIADFIGFVHLLIFGQTQFEGMQKYDPNIGFVVLKMLYTCIFGMSLVRGEVIKQKVLKV